MLRIFRYIKNLFVRKQANVKVVSPKEHEQKPYKHVPKVEKNESQDILIHRPATNKFIQDRIRTNNVYNHVTPVASVSQSELDELWNPANPLSPLSHNYWLNNDDSDSKRHNHSDNNDYSPTHIDYSHSYSDNNHSHTHHDYTPSYDSGSSYQSDSTSYDSGSSGSSDW